MAGTSARPCSLRRRSIPRIRPRTGAAHERLNAHQCAPFLRAPRFCGEPRGQEVRPGIRPLSTAEYSGAAGRGPCLCRMNTIAHSNASSRGFACNTWPSQRQTEINGHAFDRYSIVLAFSVPASNLFGISRQEQYNHTGIYH